MWHENYAARLTALRIKKTLNSLCSQEKDLARRTTNNHEILAEAESQNSNTYSVT